MLKLSCPMRASLRFSTLILLLLSLSGLSAAGEIDVGKRTETVTAPEHSLNQYRAQLVAFRKEYGGAHELPDVPFFQFGMGLRTKYLFKQGQLLNAVTGQVVRSWDATNTTIIPSAYSVAISTRSGSRILILEDEQGVWCEEAGARQLVEGTAHPVRLPTFVENRYGSILRVLHHEILMNVTAAGPLPNFYVCHKPRHRG